MFHYVIALILPKKTQQELATRLFYGLPGAIWSEPESLQVIIRDLGKLNHPQLDEVKECLSEIYFNPFKIEFSGIKYLAQNRSQGSLLLQAVEAEPLRHLKNEIESNIRDLKIPKNKQDLSILLGICQAQKVGNYLLHNSLFHSSSGEIKGCGLFAIHYSPKKVFLEEIAYYESNPFHSNFD